MPEGLIRIYIYRTTNGLLTEIFKPATHKRCSR